MARSKVPFEVPVDLYRRARALIDDPLTPEERRKGPPSPIMPPLTVVQKQRYAEVVAAFGLPHGRRYIEDLESKHKESIEKWLLRDEANLLIKALDLGLTLLEKNSESTESQPTKPES